MKTHKQRIVVVCIVGLALLILCIGPENVKYIMERTTKSWKEFAYGLEGLFFPVSACFFVVTCLRWLLKDFFKG